MVRDQVKIVGEYNVRYSLDKTVPYGEGTVAGVNIRCGIRTFSEI